MTALNAAVEALPVAADPVDGTCDYYNVGAIGVSLRTNCRAVQRAFEWSYAPYRVHQVARVVARLEARVAGSWWRGDRRYELTVNGRPGATVRRLDHVPSHLEWACNWAVAFAAPEWLQVHAACVQIGPVGVVLAGRPGSGKTTLAAVMTLLGAGYLCDEFALLDPATHRLQPFPKAMNLKEASIAVVNSLSSGLRLRASRTACGKGRVAVLPPHRVRADAIGRAVEPRLVVFPSFRPGAATRTRSIMPAEALLRLERLSFNFLAHRAAGVDLLVRVLRECTCIELEYGDARRAARELMALASADGRRAGT
jgi:HprK-related kinase A